MHVIMQRGFLLHTRQMSNMCRDDFKALVMESVVVVVVDSVVLSFNCCF